MSGKVSQRKGLDGELELALILGATATMWSLADDHTSGELDTNLQ